MVKSADNERRALWDEPLTPDALAQYGHLEIDAPEGGFDPQGTWTQCWQIYLLRQTSWEPHHQGHIEITRKPTEGRVRLAIRQANFQGPQRAILPNGRRELVKSVCDTRADLVCRGDAYLTPESWTLDTALRRVDGTGFEGTRLTKTMGIRKGRIEMTCNGRTVSRPVPPGNLTCNWGLLTTLSTLDGREPLTFTLLDELDKVKTDHHLHRAADRRIQFGRRRVAVHCYHQIGRGTLPWEYYVDASSKRVLLAISGLRAYILDDSAAAKTAEIFAGFGQAENARS